MSITKPHSGGSINNYILNKKLEGKWLFLLYQHHSTKYLLQTVGNLSRLKWAVCAGRKQILVMM